MKQVSIKSVLVLMVSLIVVSTPIHANSSQSTQCKGASKKVLKSTLSNYKKTAKVKFSHVLLDEFNGDVTEAYFYDVSDSVSGVKKEYAVIMSGKSGKRSSCISVLAGEKKYLEEQLGVSFYAEFSDGFPVYRRGTFFSKKRK